jgi:hypothetical protein
LPSVQTAVYPTAEQVMNLARAIVNDMLRTSAGQVLTDSAPFSIEYLNAAMEDCQEYLANNGLPTQILDNVILGAIPPVPVIDPSVQVYLGYNGYFNGQVILTPTSTPPAPLLPADMILPLRLWERQTGSGSQFVPMEPAKDGLPSRNQGAYFGPWDWLQGSIYLIGSTQTRDIRLRYEQALPLIGTGANLAQTTIPISGGKRALAFGVAEYYTAARGGPQAAYAKQQKIDRLDELVLRQTRKDQRITYRPQGFRDSGDRIDGSLGGSYK